MSSDPWKPSVTVAAVIERDGCFLLVEEQTADGIRLNQPAGHLDPNESLLAAATRETMEETAFAFTPTQLVGVYLWRSQPSSTAATTYLRFAFTGMLGQLDASRRLDDGILRTLWLTRDEIAARAAEHRSPLVQRCVDDYLAGVRYPLDLLFTHPSALAPIVSSAATACVAPAVAPCNTPVFAPAEPAPAGMKPGPGAQVSSAAEWAQDAACPGRQEAGAGMTKSK
jgi:8-oxo-dGTP pyrophosphatase MutT (NUDIX family)